MFKNIFKTQENSRYEDFEFDPVLECRQLCLNPDLSVIVVSPLLSWFILHEHKQLWHKWVNKMSLFIRHAILAIEIESKCAWIQASDIVTIQTDSDAKRAQLKYFAFVHFNFVFNEHEHQPNNNENVSSTVWYEKIVTSNKLASDLKLWSNTSTAVGFSSHFKA